MSRFATIGWSAALLMACRQDVTLSETEAKIEVSPRLLDFLAVEVGGTGTAVVQIDHLSGGPVDIRNVVVSNLDGTYFHYDGSTSLELEQGGSLQLEVNYSPTDEGWHRGTLEIVHSGLDGRVVVDVRGQGVAPEATVTPLGLDFGMVSVGATGDRSVVVTNNGAVDLTIDDARFSNAVFTLVEALPLTIGAGDDAVMGVRFNPTNTLPAVGALTLKVGSLALPNVSLRGNDCEDGLPEFYDLDSDGFTNCGGDCDDQDASVHPGAVELLDGTDQDCDGRIDDGTTGADDDGDGYCEDPVCTDGALPNDCADGQPAVSPAASENLTNGVDDNCDGVVDFGTTDLDGDGYAPDGGDCDDADPLRAPGFPETADNRDNDCDTIVDEGTSAYDDDGDGYCEVACTDGSTAGDCDDGAPGTSPGGSEGSIGDFTDNDCDGSVDEGTNRSDDDGDGFTEVGGDCDDTDPGLNPALGGC
jgi:hypothetical protein